jgi:polyisoprenoid-binding protein YceI
MAWRIDPSHTEISFSVKHMMITTVRGRFTSFQGTLTVDDEAPENSHAEGSVDLSSVDTREVQRDEHLRSADFFDVANHPQMTFVSTRIERNGRNRYKVYGDLQIHGVTREVIFDVQEAGRVQDPWGKQRIGFTATTKLNRRDFGLTWNVALEAGGWLVGEEVRVEIEVQAVEKEAQPEIEAVAA